MEEVKESNHESKTDGDPAYVPDHHTETRHPRSLKRKILIGAAWLLVGAAVAFLFWMQSGKPNAEAQPTKADPKAVDSEKAVPPDVAVATREQLHQITVEPVAEHAIESERET